MCDRNVKSEYILKKLCALVFEHICKRTTEFHEKILFVSFSHLHFCCSFHLGDQNLSAFIMLRIVVFTKTGNFCHHCLYYDKVYLFLSKFIFRSTSKSRPNNIRGGKCPPVRPSVRPSTKSFFDLNEIWYIGRGR